MLNRTAHILARAQAALAVSVLAAALLFGPTDAAADDVSGFRPGDIIFQTTDDGQSLAILLASKFRQLTSLLKLTPAQSWRPPAAFAWAVRRSTKVR